MYNFGKFTVGSKMLTMFLLKSVKFQLVGLVLGLLFKPASPGGQFVLLLPGAGSIS